MTSPSLRKPPITVRSTLRSRCASSLLKKGTVPLQRVCFPPQIDTADRDCPLFQQAARALARQAVVGLVFACAAWPAWSAEDDATRARPREMISSASTPLVVDDDSAIPESPPEADAAREPVSKPLRKRIRRIGDEPARTAPAVSDLARPQPARKSGRTRI